jgi:hypothetical protein
VAHVRSRARLTGSATTRPCVRRLVAAATSTAVIFHK